MLTLSEKKKRTEINPDTKVSNVYRPVTYMMWKMSIVEKVTVCYRNPEITTFTSKHKVYSRAIATFLDSLLSVPK